jgi:uncharacterized protein
MFGLIRVAIIVLIAYLAYRLVKNWLAKLDKPAARNDEKIDTMVRCQYCEVHVPQNEAIKKKGHWYCSEEHASKNTDA